ncbi:YbjN domain-containing protein [Caulobacter sp. NIBR2454]|uniref:YbjN domain-containing protein n=1 Tax=Caulobacter sp. NIBR2454 TaxID=3015996 RepID=UPI0022B61BC8|nr:YbjN domain-containing protein [Caulobacter sp. NIBR2454]
MPRRLLAYSAFAFALTAAGLANAANVTSLNPETLVQALHNAGYKAKLGKADDGTPLIETASDGNNILIIMTDCTNNASCTTTEFVGIWDCSDSVSDCQKTANTFNAQEQPTHVLMSEDGKRATTYSYLIFDKVGISEELFIRNLVAFNYYNNQFTLSVGGK